VGKPFLVSRPLRIAIVVDPLTLSAKGGEHPARLATELLGRGHFVRGFGAPPGHIPRSSADLEEADSDRAGLVRFRPDVVLAYDALSPAAAYGARAARRLDVPLILVEADAPGGGSTWQRLLWRVGEVLFRAYVRRAAGAVVALDPVAHERAIREGFSPDVIKTFPLGVDLNTFRPGLTTHVVAQHRIRGRVVLFVGPLEAQRGAETLLAAFARTVGQRDDWALVFAGDGPERARLRAMSERLGVTGRVHWLPRPRREELPGLFGASTLLAVPATEDVVLGRNVARALASGVPVLASDLPRLRYFVEDGETGLLVAPGDVAAWADAIRRAASSPMARSRWARNARATAEARFDWRDVTTSFERLFEDVRAAAPEPAAPRQSA
jgi:glycosyltransferase involved in cell wall biosynthesis